MVNKDEYNIQASLALLKRTAISVLQFIF